MKAKQLLSLLLALLTVMMMFVSCGGDKNTETNDPSKETTGPSTSGEEGKVTDDLGDVNFSDVENPTVTFFVRNESDFPYEVYVEEPIGDDLQDAIYWRNQTIKERLGVEIDQIVQACGWANYPTWNETLRNAIQNRTHDYDAAMIYTGASSSLAIDGCFMDLTDLDPINLSKPYWNQNLLKEATIYNSLYFASGSINHTQLSWANVIWYNKDLYNEFFATSDKKDIYDVVRDGEWTIDYMYELTSAVFVDNDSNGEKSSGDTVGLSGGANMDNGSMDAWIYALGCDLTKMNASTGEPEACFYNEHTVKAFEKLVNLYSNNDGSYCTLAKGGTTGDTKFENGNVLMTLGRFATGTTYRDSNIIFGVLPVPKYEAEQESYRSIPEAASSMVTVLSTVEDNRLQMVASTIELMAAESYKTVIPTYTDVVLKSKQANAPDDAEMVQTIIDSMVYSFGWIFSSTRMNDVGKAFRTVDGSRDLSSYYGQKGGVYEQNISDLIDGFAAIA